jgi:hypothetical protein
MKDDKFDFSFLDGWTPQGSATSRKSPEFEQKPGPGPLIEGTQKEVLAFPDKSNAVDPGSVSSIKQPNADDCFLSFDIKLFKILH